MSIKISAALKKLNNILPLKSNQDNCSTEVKRLHQAILWSFINTGKVLNSKEMQPLCKDLDASLSILKQTDLVVFDQYNNVTGAYPLTMEQREHQIKVGQYSLYAMCALDALSVSSLFQVKSVISSACRITQSKIHIEQNNGVVTNLKEIADIHVGIAWSAASSNSCCANNLCLEMIYLIDTTTAKQWLLHDKNNREVFTLAESVEFGSLFFNPLLDH